MLQQNKVLKVICWNLIDEIAEDKDKTTSTSPTTSLGIHEDAQNCNRLAEHLPFYSIRSLDDVTSLKGMFKYVHVV